jgi:hypothetical protein
MNGRRIMTGDEIRRAVIRNLPRDRREAGRHGRAGARRHPAPRRAPRHRIAARSRARGADLPVGALDIEFYRDDARLGPRPLVKGTDLPFEIDGTTVVLVDDVLYTGRTSAPRWTRCASSGDREAVRLPCWSIAGTASCRSAPTTSQERADVARGVRPGTGS